METIADYGEYLRSAHWYHVREVMIKYAKNRCQICDSDEKPLHVHHRNYKDLGEEHPSDLIVVCDRCHDHIHKHLFRKKRSTWKKLGDIIDERPLNIPEEAPVDAS